MKRGPYQKNPAPFCPHGHPLSGANLYRKGRRRHCRTCRARVAAKQRERLKAEDDALIEKEVAWLLDLPDICDQADQLAALRATPPPPGE